MHTQNVTNMKKNHTTKIMRAIKKKQIYIFFLTSISKQKIYMANKER